MLKVNVKANTDDIIRGLNKFERQFVPQALNKSLNRVGTGVATVVRRDVAKEAGITQRTLKQRGFFSQFRSKVKTLTYQFVVRWGSIPLKDFNPKQTKQGVVAKAWGIKQLYDNAFKVDSLGGHVFVRKTKKRLPIKKLYGPIPARIANSDRVEKKVGQTINERLPRELSRNLAFYIKRALGSV